MTGKAEQSTIGVVQTFYP